MKNATTEQVIEALINRGRSKSQLGDHEGAIADLTTIINKKNVTTEPVIEALINRGCSKSQLGDHEGAIADFMAVHNIKNASGFADEAIDLGGDFLQIDPEELEIISPVDNKAMALIPSGFHESDHYEHPVYLYPYFMDKYPVTNIEYKVFLEAMEIEPPPYWKNGKVPEGMEDHPVVGVTYDDALAYAEWAGKDLPLQQEWEIAAGAGKGYKYPWGNELQEDTFYFNLPESKEDCGEKAESIEADKHQEMQSPPVVMQENQNSVIADKEKQNKTPVKSHLLPDSEISEDKFTTGGDDHSFIKEMAIAPHNLKFNESDFLGLLSQSIYLMGEEKRRIVDSIPKLSQYQIDELIRRFEVEKKMFDALSENVILKIKPIVHTKATDQENRINFKPERMKTHSVLKYDNNRSPYNICDLIGNAFEYTRSFMNPGKTDSLLTLKGFSWYGNGMDSESTLWDKHYSFIHNRWVDAGFRCVKRIYSNEDFKAFVNQKVEMDNSAMVSWLYNRASYHFELLNSGLLEGDDDHVVEKGIRYCRRILQKENIKDDVRKRAVRLLIYFSVHKEGMPKFDILFEEGISPLVENHQFKWEELKNVFSVIINTENLEDDIEKHKRLKEAVNKIDGMLLRIEEMLSRENFKLRERLNRKSLDYALIMYEEKLTLFQYTMVSFLCTMKIKIEECIRDIEKIALLEVNILTPEIKDKTEGTIAFEVKNSKLSEITDIFIELSNVRLPHVSIKDGLIITNGKFHIPTLECGEKRILETGIKVAEKGEYPLFIALFYTDSTNEDHENILERRINLSGSKLSG